MVGYQEAHVSNHRQREARNLIQLPMEESETWSWKEVWLESQETWVLIWALPLTSWVRLEEGFNFPHPEFSRISRFHVWFKNPMVPWNSKSLPHTWFMIWGLPIALWETETSKMSRKRMNTALFDLWLLPHLLFFFFFKIKEWFYGVLFMKKNWIKRREDSLRRLRHRPEF